MCNCDNKRSELTTALSGNQQPATIPGQKAGPGIGFIYTGKSALTVTGNVTGKQYRFSAPGDSQMIDYKDASYMIMVPVLKRIG